MMRDQKKGQNWIGLTRNSGSQVGWGRKRRISTKPTKKKREKSLRISRKTWMMEQIVIQVRIFLSCKLIMDLGFAQVDCQFMKLPIWIPSRDLQPHPSPMVPSKIDHH
uniref:Uncharacterized protein n=1 Tax=Opuntia streptacantha TaxID=393608 RepID=A0A7C8Z3F2_OPUST